MGRRSGSTSSTSASADLLPVLVGRLGRPHGLRGALSVDVRTDSPDERFAPGSVLVRGGPEGPDGRELVVADAWWHSGRLLVVIEGHEDRTAAEALRGSLLYALVDPAELPAEPEEFYDHQLVGLEAVTEEGDPLGRVTEVLHLPAQDLLAIAAEVGEVLVPFVVEMVPVVDLAAGRVVVTAPPGLFDPDGDASEADGGDEGA